MAGAVASAMVVAAAECVLWVCSGVYGLRYIAMWAMSVECLTLPRNREGSPCRTAASQILGQIADTRLAFYQIPP